MLRQFFITISNENPRPYVNNLINGYLKNEYPDCEVISLRTIRVTPKNQNDIEEIDTLRNSITDYVKSSTRKDLRFEVAYY